MSNKATISADIISSTSLKVEQRLYLEKSLIQLLSLLEQTYTADVFFGRLIKGDYIECVIEEPSLALRVALLMKSFIKSLNIESDNKKDKRFKEFKEYGIRVAIGIGDLSIWDKEKGIIDGEAIHLSGRAINEMSSLDRLIGNTIAFRSNNNAWNQEFSALFNLLDFIFAKHKKEQSKVIFYKLLGKTEKELIEILNKGQSTINQHSTTSGWWAIHSAVTLFEQTIH